MEKSAREKIPNVLALLMGMLGLVIETVWCYFTQNDPSPKDVAVKASIAWGVMLVLGYVNGFIIMRFVPESQPRGTVKKDEKKEGEAAKPGGAASIAAAPAPGANTEAVAANTALNILLNESPGALMGNAPTVVAPQAPAPLGGAPAAAPLGGAPLGGAAPAPAPASTTVQAPLRPGG